MALTVRQLFTRNYPEMLEKSRRLARAEFSDPTSPESVLNALFVNMVRAYGTSQAFPTEELRRRANARYTWVLLTRVRLREAQKRGARMRALELNEGCVQAESSDSSIEIDVRRMLEALAVDHRLAAQVVWLVDIEGYTRVAAAESLSVSLATVDRKLALADRWFALYLRRRERAVYQGSDRL